MVLGKLFEKIKNGLAKTARSFGSGLRALLGRTVDAQFLADLERHLIAADVGVAATETILEHVKQAYENKEATGDLLEFVKAQLRQLLEQSDVALAFAPAGPTVIMVAGVNGSGKTTSIAKLAWFLSKQGKKVLLGAADTFRAAAIEQLERWSQRIDAGFVKGLPGGDPAAVAHDACVAAVARGIDVVIIDTAGRLHTHTNLMKELQKIHRVVGKAIAGAPHEVLLVLDATNGQNAIQQAMQFTQAVQCTGIILAKLDGTAKGGAVVAIRRKLNLPVKFVGVGEKPDDLEVFDADQFVEGLFGAA
jgi:fused signal recognition particle receptor